MSKTCQFNIIIINLIFLINITKIFISATNNDDISEIAKLCQNYPEIVECLYLPIENQMKMEKRKSAYMRLGKRKSAYMRFGKRGVVEDNQIPDAKYIDINGLLEENQPMEKRKSAYMRFGKRKSAYMRLG